MTPSERTKKYLKDRGWRVGTSSWWNPFVPRGDGQKGMRQDLFGCIDMIGIPPDGMLAGIQVTASSGHSARLNKILASDDMRAWVGSGARLLIISWGKKGPRGKRKLWEPRIQEVTKEDFDNEAVTLVVPIPATEADHNG
jgi:hypothetical protein